MYGKVVSVALPNITNDVRLKFTEDELENILIDLKLEVDEVVIVPQEQCFVIIAFTDEISPLVRFFINQRVDVNDLEVTTDYESTFLKFRAILKTGESVVEQAFRKSIAQSTESRVIKKQLTTFCEKLLEGIPVNRVA